MQKLNKSILLAVFMGLGTLHFHSLYAQDKKETKQQVIIIEETIDENGNKKTRKIVTKGIDLNENEVEKILFDIEQMSKNIEIIVETDEGKGEETIIIQEFETTGDQPMIWKTEANDFHFEEQDPKATIGVMLGDFGEKGAKIRQVVKNSGAETAGLKEGDIIASIGETKIISFNDVQSAMAENEIGDKVNIEYHRGEKSLSAKVELKENDFGIRGFEVKKARPHKQMKREWKSKNKDKKASLGVMIEQEDDIVSIDEVIVGSAAEKAGLQEGDIITSVNGNDVKSYEVLVKTIQMAAETDGELEIEYKRAGKSNKTTAQVK